MTSLPRASDSLSSSLAGDLGARGRLAELVYEDLRLLAASHMRAERSNHTLQPTALVHEAFMRLIDQDGLEPKGRTHFFALAATSMRRILVDHARAKLTRKRGDARAILELEDERASTPEDPNELLALDEALEQLAKLQARQAKVVELRYFAGMSIAETADALGVSPETVKLDWRFARAWLNSRLTRIIHEPAP